MKGGLTAQLDLIEELGLGFEDCTCDSHRSAGQLRLACCSESAASHRDTLCRHRQGRVFIIFKLPSFQTGRVGDHVKACSPPLMNCRSMVRQHVMC